jgi:type I restriction enzyme S subunit
LLILQGVTALKMAQNKFKQTEIGTIPEEWTCSKLGDVCFPEDGIQTGPFGSQLHQRDYVLKGTPIITVEHLGENRILHQNLPRVSDADRKRLSRYSLKSGDIVFSRVGSVDLRALVRQKEDGWLFSGRCLRVRPDPNIVDSDFLSWLFGLPAFREHMRRIAVGATMPSINTKLLNDAPVFFPKLAIQKEIAKILVDLDEKIELNNQMNKTFEAMGHALFKRWFIDFEFPNEKGLPYKSSGGKMVDSEFGKIPLNWHFSTMPEVADVIDCLHTKKPERVEDSQSFLLQLNNIGALATIDLTDKYLVSQADYSEWTKNIEVQEGDCIITNAGLVGAIARIPEGLKTGIGRNFTAIRSTKILPTYLFSYLISEYGRSEIANNEDQGTIFNSLNVKGIKKIQVLIPEVHILKNYDAVATALRKNLESNVLHNHSLAELRNSLLPKLMSGEIRIG